MNTTPLPAPKPVWPWVRAVAGEGFAHRRVRLAMYAMMALLAVLSLFRAWRIGESEIMRQMDMEIIQAAAEQGTLTQRLGAQAAQLANPDDVAQEEEMVVEAPIVARDANTAAWHSFVQALVGSAEFRYVR